MVFEQMAFEIVSFRNSVMVPVRSQLVGPEKLSSLGIFSRGRWLNLNCIYIYSVTQ